MVGIRTETLMTLLEMTAPSRRLWLGNYARAARSGEAGGGERGVRRVDGRRRAHGAGDRVQGLEPVAGVDHHGLQRGVELAGLDQLLQYADRGAPRRLGEDPLRPRQEHDRVADLVVVDVLDRATGLPADVEHVDAVGRVADRQALGDRVRLDRADRVDAALVGDRDRGAAGGLRAVHLVGLVLDQAELDQLLEGLVHLGQLGAGRDRDDDLVGQPPAELLGDLVAQGLGALGVVGADVDVDERPAVLLAGDLRGEPVDVVVVAVHGDQRVGVDRGVHLLGLLEVARDEDDGLDAGAGARRRDGVGEVAGRRAGEHLAVELAGRAERAGHDAVLEGVGGVGRVVLHPQVVDAQLAAEVVRLEQPREAGLHVGALLDVGGDREQRLVAPDVARPGLDLLAGHGREVVGDLERPEALRTRVVGTEVDLVAALAARQRPGVAEGALAERVARGGAGGGCLLGDDSAHEVLLLIFPGASLAPGRNWHRFRDHGPGRGCGGSRRLPGLHRAVPSVPLDELGTTVSEPSQHVHIRSACWAARPRRTTGQAAAPAPTVAGPVPRPVAGPVAASGVSAPRTTSRTSPTRCTVTASRTS